MKLLDFFRDLFSDNKEEVNSQNQPKMSGVITPARREKMGKLNTKFFKVKKCQV